MSLSANSKAVTTAVVGCQVDAIKYDEKKFTAIIYIICKSTTDVVVASPK